MSSLVKPKTLVQVQNLKKSFNGNAVIKDISFEVEEGEVLVIVGPSGCGKSTVLKMLAGLQEPDSGEIYLENPNYSMVFQYSALFDSLSVYENVAFSLLERPDKKATGPLGRIAPFRDLPEKEIRQEVAQKLKMVGLEGIESKFPNELSGGMKKRVSFARAIMGNPRIMFYDEPTAGLDPIASTMTENYILKLRDELNAASIVVTHQFSTIHRTADRICLLHDGYIQWEGTPDQLAHSDNRYAKQFFNASLEGPMTKEGA